MRTLLTYVFALLAVGGLLFLAASFAFGRDEEMAPALPEGTPVELPDDRPATGADLRALRLAVVLRGYRMEEVDWVLDRLAEQIDSRDREIVRLRSVLHVEPMRTPGPDETGRAVPAGGTGETRGAPTSPAALGEDDERLSAPDEPVPVQAAGDGAVPSRDRELRRLRPGNNPVRGLRPDGGPDRDQR